MRVHSEEYAAVYDDLRRIAAFHMSADRIPQGMELIQGALSKQQDVEEKTKYDLIGMAVTAIRDVLIAYARQRLASRDKGGADLPADKVYVYTESDWDKLIVLDEALTELAREHPLAARILELRAFGGFSEKEISELVDNDLRTVRQHWNTTETFLSQYLPEKVD